MQDAHFHPNSPHPDWLIPQWPAPPGVRALFTTRNGGVSQSPWASLNLGLHVGDDAGHVRHNRSTVQQALGARAVFLSQTHGTDVLALEPDTPDGLSADAACTSRPALACTVMVADCLPVLLCDTTGQQVAAAHAGWRGLLGQGGRGVLEQTVLTMRGRHAARLHHPPDPQGPSDSTNPAANQCNGQEGAPLLAWLGPCIGPRAFEVGSDVRDAFLRDNEQAESHFVPLGGGQWLADLPGLARQCLQALGDVAVYGNDGSDAWCTVRQPLRYFSHRRDRISGRMAACIWLEGGVS